MIKIGAVTYFNKLNIKCTTTVCEKAGDFFGDNPLARIGFSSNNYVRRHYVTSGRFKASYPDTVYPDEYDGVGCVWPFSDYKEVNNYVVTAMEDNSAFHCFLPIGSRRMVTHEFFNLSAGEEYLAKVGKIYSPDVDSYVNGNFTKAFTLIACQENDSTITLTKDGKIAAFFTILPYG
jgi:hypothetical protein